MNKTNNSKKNLLFQFLSSLNNEQKISSEDIEHQYKEILPLIDFLYSIEDFPFNSSTDGNVYCFKTSKRKPFDKYQIEEIVSVILEFHDEKAPMSNSKNCRKIIEDYIENNSHHNKHIEMIVLDYAMSKNDNNSKKLVSMFTKGRDKQGRSNTTEEILRYINNTNFCRDIANTILDIKMQHEFTEEIQKILYESKLPRRDDETYKIISDYAPYEITHCISYEMAIRNQDVQDLLHSIKKLTILSKKLFEYSNNFGNITIEENPYFNIEHTINESTKLLERYKIKYKVNLQSNNYKTRETFVTVMQIITNLIKILEEEFYMVYNREEIIPKGMEEIFLTPNHHEPDLELNQYMNQVIEQSIKSHYDTSPNYKDNYAIEDGYVIYQASYEGSKEYDINKIFPNFKRPMREFNQTQVAFNISLPKKEIIAYIEKIKNDYDRKNTAYKTLNQLFDQDNTRKEDELKHKRTEQYADDFFIYDYYTQSKESQEVKLDNIQKKLSQYHGKKLNISPNKYKQISFDEANQEKTQTKKKNQVERQSQDELKQIFDANPTPKDYLDIYTIKKRYKILKEAIEEKKYKNLINHQ